MRRLLAILLLLPLCQVAWGATYQFTDPSAALTAIPTMTASDTMKLGCTLAGPVTLSAGTYDVLPGHSWGVTSNNTDTSSGSIRISGPTTIKSAYVSNTSATSGRAIWSSGTASVLNGIIVESLSSASAAININNPGNTISSCRVFCGSNAGVVGAAGGGSLTITGSVIKSTGPAIVNGGTHYICNNSIVGSSVGVSITTGTYANNIFYNVTSPVTGASATFMTYSAWNGDVSSWGAGCVSLAGSPYRMTPDSNPWSCVPGPWFPGNFSAVSIAGVTDQPSIIGVPTGSTIGAVPYIPIGLGDDEEYWHDGR